MNIPHIEQKHNTNQLSLHHISNLAYQQGKSAANYDNVNSSTTHNNHYTLLYPDLVQELFNFALHNSNSTKNNALFFGGLGVNHTKNSSLSSSLNPSPFSSLGSTDSSLSPRDILFFLQIVSLYQLELSKGNSSITYPSLKLSKLLGVDASCDTGSLSGDANMRATILKMTSKLEALGFLKVFRRKRKNGMDMANKLVPVLPDRLHARIKDSPSNLKVSDSSKLDHESNLEHILRTKLFVPIELEFMKSLFKDKMSSKYKLFFLNCIMSAYRNFRHNSSSRVEEDAIDVPNMFSFSATSSELGKKNNISRSTLDRIFRYVKQQGDSFFLQVEHKYTKSDDIDSNRYDKSIFVISINPLVFPMSKSEPPKEEISNINHDKLPSINSSTFPDTYEGFKTAWSKKQPSIVTKAAHNNKDIIIKNKYSRNIDYIDASCENLETSAIDNPPNTHTSFCSEILETLKKTKNTAINHKEEFLEEEQSSSSSKSHNNSSFSDVFSGTSSKSAILKKKATQAPDKTQRLELRHFYPLSEKDVDTLNFRAGREFSNNFMNQLLLKLYIKYPEKRFKNKFTFLSYMAKILKNEKHQGPLVNHISFRFSCNIGAIEKNLLEYEKYLNQIESSFDTSKEMQVRKKIAGRFSTELAYKILTKVQFKTNYDNSFIKAIIPKRLDLGGVQTESLSERQIATLSEQLEAVYGINGYYVQEVEQEEQIADIKTEDVRNSEDGRLAGGRKEDLEKQYSKIKEPDIISSSKDIGILGNSQEFDTIEENTVWNQIRKGMREELGEALYAVWFSKAVAAHCNDTKTLTLTMPTRFMSDWVRNNYSHVIRRLSERCGVKRVEYG